MFENSEESLGWLTGVKFTVNCFGSFVYLFWGNDRPSYDAIAKPSIEFLVYLSDLAINLFMMRSLTGIPILIWVWVCSPTFELFFFM